MNYVPPKELIVWLSTAKESMDIVGNSKVSVRVIEEKVDGLPQISQPILYEYRDETLLILDLRGQLKMGTEALVKRMKNPQLTLPLIIRGMLMMHHFENKNIFNPILTPVSNVFTRVLTGIIKTSFQMNVYETEITQAAVNIFTIFNSIM